jgi:hypothetical protein
MWQSGLMGAGGMRNRRGPTLAERGTAARGASGADTDQSPAPRGPRRRHCWVTEPSDGSGPWPGLVIEWQVDSHGWRARVVYVVGAADSATSVETWVDAVHLRPA